MIVTASTALPATGRTQPAPRTRSAHALLRTSLPHAQTRKAVRRGRRVEGRTAAALRTVPAFVVVFRHIVATVLQARRVEGVGAKIAAHEVAALLTPRAPVVVLVCILAARAVSTVPHVLQLGGSTPAPDASA
jgi:hypothetical protein